MFSVCYISSLVIDSELEDKLDKLLRKCKCSKISVVTVAGDEPDTDQTNTFQLLDGDVVYFIACDGTAVLIDSGVSVPLDAANIANGSVSSTEFQFLNTVTSNIQTQLDGKSATGHTHDDRYFTEAEVTASLALKSNTGHTHVTADITDLLIESAAYGPSKSTEVNVTVSLSDFQYLRIDNVVTISGHFSATVTAAGEASFKLSVPVSSNFSGLDECGGGAFNGSIAAETAEVAPSVGESLLIVKWQALDFGAPRDWFLHATYRLV
jgi:hypothetical protein